MAPAVARRLDGDATRVADWLSDDLGVTRRTALCLLGVDVEIDSSEFVPFGQQLHAAAFGSEAVVVVNALDLKRVQPAIAYGLAYTALWETAASLDLPGYPQPLADAVSQWYMARATNSLEAHHATMLRANFLQDPSGTQPPADWTASGPQPPVFVWNPQFIESPVGDMVEFAVTADGSDVLLDPTAETWAVIETEYKANLSDELFGDIGGSFGWPWGLTLVAVILLLAAGLSGFEWRRKKRAEARRPVADPPLEGFFQD